MSRKIVLYIATSLDGYIARRNGAVDWLNGDGDKQKGNNGFASFYSTIYIVVMSRTTYKQVINELSPDLWVYEGKKCYVATTKRGGADRRA
jgi:dihydrofolate reductase